MNRMKPFSYHGVQEMLRSCSLKKAYRFLSHQQKAFTLIELLFVCGIIALLASLAMVSFVNINRGANLKSAERQLLAATFTARQFAVNYRQPVMLAIPYWTDSTTNVYVRPDMLWRSYMFIAKQSQNSSSREQLLGKAEALPAGILFDQNSFNGWQDELYTLYYTKNNNAPYSFRIKYIRYSPNGNIYWQDVDNAFSSGISKFQLGLKEGQLIINNTTATPRYKNSSITNGVSINVNSGRCEISGSYY